MAGEGERISRRDLFQAYQLWASHEGVSPRDQITDMLTIRHSSVRSA
jgi:hypothetical protein